MNNVAKQFVRDPVHFIMPDVFISYSSKDSELARWLYSRLAELKVTTFLAELSIQGGADWKPEVLQNLREAEFVLFLATPNSCSSDAVKHEIGGALALQKVFLPIMAGVQPSQLPSWIQDKQAVNIYDGEQSRAVFERIAEAVTSKRFLAGVVAAAVIMVGLYFLGKNAKANAA